MQWSTSSEENNALHIDTCTYTPRETGELGRPVLKAERRSILATVTVTDYRHIITVSRYRRVTINTTATTTIASTNNIYYQNGNDCCYIRLSSTCVLKRFASSIKCVLKGEEEHNSCYSTCIYYYSHEAHIERPGKGTEQNEHYIELDLTMLLGGKQDTIRPHLSQNGNTFHTRF